MISCKNAVFDLLFLQIQSYKEKMKADNLVSFK